MRDDKYQLIIDFAVCRDLIERGYPFIMAVQSNIVEDRYVYVFYNTPELARELEKYDESTYYPIKEAIK